MVELWAMKAVSWQNTAGSCILSCIKALFSCIRIMESRSGWGNDCLLIFLRSISKLKCFIKTLFAKDVRDPFAWQKIAKWIVQCFPKTRLLTLFLLFGFFSQTHSYLLHNSNKMCQLWYFQIMQGDTQAVLIRTMVHFTVLSSGSTDRCLWHKCTYYRSKGIFSSTIYLLFVSYFLSKITKRYLEICRNLQKPIYVLLTSCSNLWGQLPREGPYKSPGFLPLFQRIQTASNSLKKKREIFSNTMSIIHA